MILLVYLAALACMFAMFLVSRPYKIAIIYLTEMVFMIVKIPYLPYGFAIYLVPLFFIFSEIPDLISLVKKTKRTIVWQLLSIFLISIVVAIIFSPHLHDVSSIRSFFRSSALFTYFLLLYAFWCYSDEKSLIPTLRLSMWGMIFITVVGVFNLVFRHAGWIEFVLGDQMTVGDMTSTDLANRFMHNERFRNQSVFLFAFDYGICCLSVLLLHVYSYFKKLEKTWPFIIVTACCLFGIFTCACRTVLFCTIICLLYFFIKYKGFSRSINSVAIIVSIFLLSYEFVPYVNKSVDSMMTMFASGDDADDEGSSMEGRLIQYAAVGRYLQGNVLFGNGVGFFAVDLKGAEDPSERVDSDLQGLESVSSSYLLERGVVGLILFYVFWVVAFAFLKKRKKYDLATAEFGCSLIIAYILFANMTGELHSLMFVLPLLGYAFRRLSPKFIVRVERRKLKKLVKARVK